MTTVSEPIRQEMAGVVKLLNSAQPFITPANMDRRIVRQTLEHSIRGLQLALKMLDDTQIVSEAESAPEPSKRFTFRPFVTDDLEHARQALAGAALAWAFERRNAPELDVGPEADLLAAVRAYAQITGQRSRSEIEAMLEGMPLEIGGRKCHPKA